MRISTNTVIDNSITNISQAYDRFAEAQQLVSTGKQLNVPSDNPAGLTQALQFQNTLESDAQYQNNITNVNGFLGSSDAALNNAEQLLNQARTIAEQSASGTLDNSARQALAEQIDTITNQLALTANSTYGSRYIFAGERTTQPAFVNNGGVYTYQGGTQANNDADLTAEIGQNNKIVYNTTGDVVFSPAFTTLNQLRDDIANNQISNISNNDLAALDTALNGVISARAQAGANGQALDTQQQQLSLLDLNTTKSYSDIVDADTPKAVVGLQSAELTYQSALAAGGRAFQKTLLDFLQ